MKALVAGSPIGPVALLSGERGVRALGFTADPRELTRLLPAALRAEPIEAAADTGLTSRLAAYFDGDVGALAGVPLELGGTDWLGAVWSRLRQVPPGRTRTYAQVAADLGARSPRAVGLACARNSVSLLVPCHRIVGGDGSLRGYLWGTERKAWLLEHERAWAASP